MGLYCQKMVISHDVLVSRYLNFTLLRFFAVRKAPAQAGWQLPPFDFLIPVDAKRR
jgi:hypothetical protein